MRDRWMLLVALVGVMAGACNSGSTPVPTTPSRSTSTSAVTITTIRPLEIDYHSYVEDALSLLEHDMWNSGDIDWDELRSKVLGGLGDDPTEAEAYLAIEGAVMLIGDRHTMFRRPSEAPSDSDGLSDVLPSGGRLEGSIGYLDLPGTSGLSADGLAQYASLLNRAMRLADEESPVCGWVIDLRENGGGSVHPMLLGLGPLFGDGVFLAYPRGLTEFSYRNGDLFVNGIPLNELEYTGHVTSYDSPYTVTSPLPTGLDEGSSLDNPYAPQDPDAPVAVLTSGLTASAGEGVLVGFLGRPDTRTFGLSTNGVPTGAHTVQFVDGASLRIAGSEAQDRNGTLYIESIRPDERIVDLYPQDDTDETLNAATSWLESTCP